jgi:hypothetical protein
MVKVHFCSLARKRRLASFLSRYIVGGFRNFAFGEYSHTLRLASELADLRVANANRILLRPKGAQSTIRCEGVASKKNRHAIACLFFLRCVDKKDALYA